MEQKYCMCTHGQICNLCKEEEIRKSKEREFKDMFLNCMEDRWFAGHIKSILESL